MATTKEELGANGQNKKTTKEPEEASSLSETQEVDASLRSLFKRDNASGMPLKV